ncbi:MAG: hypothetical protein J0L99_07060 [Chitinophagales bacterium]|nr:hypothetical protein [Chitinophagales bacterium]
MKNTKLLFTLFVLLSFVFACKKDDPETGRFEKGVIVVNEGPFQTGTGTITHYDPATKTVSNDIFGGANGGAILGNIAQSITYHQDKAYIVVNNANKIMIAEAGTMKYLGEIRDLALPRYFLPVSDTRAWVSLWGANGIDGAVAQIDLSSNKVLQTIPVGKGPEELFLDGNKLYVPLSGGYDRDKRIIVLDASSGNLLKSIETPADNPTAMVRDAQGNHWCLCKGYFDFITPANSTLGTLFQLKNDVVQAILLPVATGTGRIAISPEGNNIYYSSSSDIRRININGVPILQEIFATKAGYSLAVNPQNGQVYAGDPIDYTGNGLVRIFNAGGVQQDSFRSGIIPTHITFRNE